MKRTETLPGLLEEVMQDTVKVVADDFEWLLDIFMPDGVPFGMEKRSEQEQLEQYLSEGLHNDPEAAANWIRANVGILIAKLREFGADEETIAAAHPFDIVQTAGYRWSAKMERLLGEKMRAAQATPVAPSVTQLDELGTDEEWLLTRTL